MQDSATSRIGHLATRGRDHHSFVLYLELLTDNERWRLTCGNIPRIHKPSSDGSSLTAVVSYFAPSVIYTLFVGAHEKQRRIQQNMPALPQNVVICT